MQPGVNPGQGLLLLIRRNRETKPNVTALRSDGEERGELSV